MARREMFALAPLAFFAGATGLLYEISFARMLTPLLGNSPAASLATLAAFTIGVALGSRLSGGLSDRAPRPLLIFAGLECLAALLALGLPQLPSLMSGPVSFLLAHVGDSAAGGFTVRFVIAFVLLVLPGIIVGGTLPPLVRHALAGGEARLSWLYGANTLGAALGAVVGGLILLQRYGLLTSCRAAATLDGVLALAAVVILLRGAGRHATPRADVCDGASSDVAAWALLVLVACTGFATLALEVVWARVLPFSLGNGLHLLPLLLATVLTGLGAGAWIDALLARRGRARHAGLDLALRLAVTVLAIPLCIRAAVLLYLGAGEVVWTPFSSPLANLTLNRALHVSVPVLLPSLALGTIFPAAARLRCRDAERAGRRFGAAMAASSLGLLAGALVTPTVIIPLVGVEGAARLVAATLLAVSLLVVVVTRPAPRRSLILYSVLALVGATACLVMPRDAVRSMLRRGRSDLAVLHYEEGSSATVAVLQQRDSGVKHLYVNSVGEVPDTLYGLQAFRMLGHLPVLLHPQPRRALMITFGGGIATGTLLAHPLQAVDVVDIEPGVFAASRQFEHVNHHPLRDPRLRLHVQDGRNFLLAHRGLYDVIVSDSTHPGSGDSWVLYTREFYSLCKSRLTDDGLMVQWLPLHAISVGAYLSVVATLSDVFGHSSVWLLGQHSVVVGSARPTTIDLPRVARLLATTRVAADMAPVGLGDVASLLDTVVAGPSAVRQLARGIRRTTDDLPWAAVVEEESDPSPVRIARGLLRLRSAAGGSPLRELGVSPDGELARRLACLARAAPFLIAGECHEALQQCPNAPKVRQCAAAVGQRAP